MIRFHSRKKRRVSFLNPIEACDVGGYRLGDA